VTSFVRSGAQTSLSCDDCLEHVFSAVLLTAVPDSSSASHLPRQVMLLWRVPWLLYLRNFFLSVVEPGSTRSSHWQSQCLVTATSWPRWCLLAAPLQWKGWGRSLQLFDKGTNPPDEGSILTMSSAHKGPPPNTTSFVIRISLWESESKRHLDYSTILHNLSTKYKNSLSSTSFSCNLVVWQCLPCRVLVKAK
jgi:hypothetical protein